MKTKAPVDDNDLGTITTPKLALLLGMTVSRLGQMQADGIIVKRGRGEYDLWKSVSGYVAYCQRKRKGGGADSEGGIDGVKLQKTNIEVEILEHKLSVLKGEFVSTESQLAAGMQLGLAVRGIFLRVESELTPRLAGRNAAECSEIIREYMHGKLVELSQYESPITIPTS